MGEKIVPGSTVDAVLEGLEPETKYRISVYATYSSGEGDPVEGEAFTDGECSTPLPPFVTFCSWWNCHILKKMGLIFLHLFFLEKSFQTKMPPQISQFWHFFWPLKKRTISSMSCRFGFSNNCFQLKLWLCLQITLSPPFPRVWCNCWRSGGRNVMDRVRRKGGVNSHRINELFFQAITLSSLHNPQTEAHWVILMFVIYISWGSSVFLFAKHYVVSVRVKAGSNLSCSVGKVKKTERPGIASCFIARTGKQRSQNEWRSALNQPWCFCCLPEGAVWRWSLRECSGEASCVFTCLFWLLLETGCWTTLTFVLDPV